MSKIGYIRTNAEDQSWDRQIAIMEEFGVDTIFQDKTSSKSSERRGFEALMNNLRNSDELYIESFSRLAMSIKEFSDVIEKLQSMGVILISKKENIDTSTPEGKLLPAAINMYIEIERDISKERQREGIEKAKEQGIYKGRKKIEDGPELERAICGWERGELTAIEAAKMAGVSRATFYNRLKEYGIKK